MKRFLMLVALLAPLGLAACGQPLVVAEAAITEEGTGERLALGNLPIRLIPYDRDAVFDSLEQAYPDPEPAIPPEILQQQQQVQEAQTAWRTAEERWATIRDSLRIISDDLDRMSQQGLRGTPQYAQAFARFTPLEQQEAQAEREMQQAFARFDQLQQQTLVAADSIRIQREMWAEQAYASFNQVTLQKVRDARREEIADTTNAQGFVRVRVPSGRWWLYARYMLPYEELYWNLPVDVSGDSTHVSLSRENAQIRPVL